MTLILLASGAVALAAMIISSRAAADKRLYQFARLDAAASSASAASTEVPTTLVLELLAVALQSGTSVLRSLDLVGAAINGQTGAALRQAAQRLSVTSSWDDVWGSICHSSSAPASRTLTSVRDCLRSPWERGIEAAPQIRAMIERLDSAERSNLEQRSSRLSVDLLVPTALCFLPAFLCIAVIPTIAAMMG
ncbi:type II secretion system protein [Bifidobacterium dolichotidis]|uniref:Type II secretion system protein n=1 Tax=Bifidobacterium dolichotidis TaxID=2306976 RepID=A0A430FQR3_9BIFI|nr:type II secretion system F family protein [Bifidobacterium dolichotidis]RSX55161.1 type II secretion system protein [Bifidobacterium dolichotidis]